MNNPTSQSSLSLSWQFIQLCLRFFSNNKRLLLIPLSGLLIIIAILATLILIFSQIYPELSELNQANSNLASTELIVGFILLYFLLSFINLFFNSALLACVVNRLKGQTFSIGQGFALAFTHITKIFIWSLINASIGLIINLLQRSHRTIRRIVLMLLGFSWTIISYFVLPLIVMDDLGPFAALRKSYELFKGGWRKMFSIFSVMILIALPFIALVVAIGYLTFKSALPLLILFILALVLVMVFLASFLETIVKAALYLDLFHHEQTKFFEKELLDRVLIKPEG